MVRYSPSLLKALRPMVRSKWENLTLWQYYIYIHTYIIIIIIIEGLSLLQSIPPTTADKQTQAHTV